MMNFLGDSLGLLHCLVLEFAWRGTEKKHEKPQQGSRVILQRFETDANWKKTYSFTATPSWSVFSLYSVRKWHSFDRTGTYSSYIFIGSIQFTLDVMGTLNEFHLRRNVILFAVKRKPPLQCYLYSASTCPRPLHPACHCASVLDQIIEFKT